MTERKITILEIKQRLSGLRVHKFGPMPGDGARELWLSQMDECAQQLGLPNVYRSHPFKTPEPRP